MTTKIDRAGKVGRPSLVLQEERNNEMVSMLLECKPRVYIYEQFKDKYNIGTKAVDALITKGYTLIRDNFQPNREAIINQHIQKYYQIADNCNGIDNKNQIAALQAVEKLMKLHTPETLVQQNTLNLDLKDMSINDLKQLLAGD